MIQVKIASETKIVTYCSDFNIKNSTSFSDFKNLSNLLNLKFGVVVGVFIFKIARIKNIFMVYPIFPIKMKTTLCC